MARPKLEIDSKVVETLAKVGATNCEIADHFCCNETTIRTRFSEILTKARADRRIKLREFQWRSAEKGNVTMQIWLGKQELGQTEKIEEKKDIKTESIQTVVYKSEWANKSKED